MTLREGDAIRVTFPGAANLDTAQVIRPDGRITMPVVGEVVAAGLKPAELEKQLLDLFAPQLVTKEVSVTVVSTTFTVFVSGAVIRPGKIVTDRPISAFQAVMEAGGFDPTKANMKAVVVVRQEGDKTRNYTVNLRAVIDGTQKDPFMLQPFDTVWVPEKFSWF